MKLVISFFLCFIFFGSFGQDLKEAERLVKNGNLSKAKELYVRALRGRKQCTDSTLLIVKNLATVMVLIGDVNQALVQLLNFSDCSKQNAVYEIYNTLGVVYGIRKNIDSSIFYYKKAVKGVKDKIKVYNNLGVLYASKGDIDSSLYYHSYALGYYQQRGDSARVSRVYNNMARTLVKVFPDSAIMYYQKSLIASRMNRFLVLESLTSLSKLTRQPAYILKADSLIKVLQKNIIRRNDKLRLLRQSRKVFKLALEVFTRLYEKTKSRNHLGLLFYFSEREKGNVLLSQLQKKVLDINEVQKNIEHKEGMLEYFQVEGGLFCFVITKQNKQLVKVNSIASDSLRLVAQGFMRECNTLGLHDFMDLSPKLYRLLFGRVSGLLQGIDKLVVVPTVSLSNLPFEALMSEKRRLDMQGYQGAGYLLKRFAISYHISATLAVLNTKQRYNPGFVGIAHSIFSNGLKPLPYGEKEVLAANKYYNGVVLRNNKASLGQLKGLNVTRLHISTHGYFDRRNSESGLWLKDGKKDTVLNVEGVFRLLPKSKLVVLSGCNSSDGKAIDSEGIVNLPYAFSYSGSRFVLSSLWVLPDKTTAQFMGKFYGYLQRFSESRALQLAKIDMIKSTLPFFWTSFVLLGK